MHRLTYAEAVNVYVAWRAGGAEPVAARIGAEVLGHIRDSLDRTLPDPVGGESPEQAVARALRDGAFRSPEDTATYFSQLADVLLPPGLAEALIAGADARRPRLVVEPSPTLARVPWSALLVGPERRMLGEVADVVIGVPAAIAALARAPHDGDVELVALDPIAPGLRPVLGPAPGGLPGTGGGVADGSAGRRLDVEWLLRESPSAASFLFVGHVSAAGEEEGSGESTMLHLSTPVTAAELMRAGWRAPRRVGLAGCGAGTDFRHPEPFGLAMTAVMCGAELVAASTWTLPTQAAMGEPATATARAPRNLLGELAAAMSAAFRSDDPAGHLLGWQVERARAWYGQGGAADNPAVWASLAVFARDRAAGAGPIA